MAEEKELNYSFYAPHLLYLLMKDKEEQIKLKKPKGKPGRRKKGEEEVKVLENEHDVKAKKYWDSIRQSKLLLGPIEPKFKKQYKDLYENEKDNSIPSRGTDYLPNLKKINGVIHKKANELWNVIKKELPLTLSFPENKNIDFTITINNLDDFKKLIKSPLDSLRVINRNEMGLKSENKELKTKLKEKEEEVNILLKEKEAEITEIKNNLNKYNNQKYKHYVEHPEDIDAKIKEIKAKMSETTDNDELNRLEEEENTLIAINNLHVVLDDTTKQLNKIEDDMEEIINAKDIEITEKENVIKEKNEEIDTKRDMLAHANAKRHEAEVEKKQLKEELKAKDEQPKTTYQPSNTPPTLKDYIKDKVINKSYSLEKDELMNVIEKDINEHKLPKDIDVSKLADTIYLQGAKYINKHMKKIKSLAKLTGYDNDLYNKLPPELADEIQKYIHDKALEDIRKKNIRYILPKEMPRWEKAVNKGINPMLGRGAWSK